MAGVVGGLTAVAVGVGVGVGGVEGAGGEQVQRNGSSEGQEAARAASTAAEGAPVTPGAGKGYGLDCSVEAYGIVGFPDHHASNGTDLAPGGLGVAELGAGTSRTSRISATGYTTAAKEDPLA